MRAPVARLLLRAISGSVSTSRRSGLRTPFVAEPIGSGHRGRERDRLTRRRRRRDRSLTGVAYESMRAPGPISIATLKGNPSPGGEKNGGYPGRGKGAERSSGDLGPSRSPHPVSSPAPYGRVPLPSSGHQGTASMPLGPSATPATDAATSPRRDGRPNTGARHRRGAPAQAGHSSDGGPSRSPRRRRAGPAAAGTGRTAGRSSRTTTTASPATPASRDTTHTAASAGDARPRALQQRRRPQRPISAHCPKSHRQQRRGPRRIPWLSRSQIV